MPAAIDQEVHSNTVLSACSAAGVPQKRSSAQRARAPERLGQILRYGRLLGISYRSLKVVASIRGMHVSLSEFNKSATIPYGLAWI